MMAVYMFNYMCIPILSAIWLNSILAQLEGN